jgi:hypothetical protein
MCFVIEREIYLYNNFEFTLFPYGMMKDKNVYMIFPTKIIKYYIISIYTFTFGCRPLRKKNKNREEYTV